MQVMHRRRSACTCHRMHHCLPQRVSRSPQTPNINPYSTYKMALLSVLYILADAQFILAGANTGVHLWQGGAINHIKAFIPHLFQDQIGPVTESA